MNLIKEIQEYEPINEQEKEDKERMLFFLNQYDNCLLRENRIGHFTASAWIVNKERKKTLLIYHKIYDSWAWVGGHADGEKNLREVAIKEVKEETGVKNIHFISDKIFSLEVLTVDGHEKKGQYISSHLHFNITYLVECDEKDDLVKNVEETKGVRWFRIEEIDDVVSEPWMMKRIYKKLIEKQKEMM